MRRLAHLTFALPATYLLWRRLKGRASYFYGKLLSERDLTDEQSYGPLRALPTAC